MFYNLIPQIDTDLKSIL